ncbi:MULTISPECIES: hypothetical protein [Pantoea]|jgi:hypothetical protein|uniref:Uncharacterized protein n=1 Tax=Pantoea brenneri TaxID=472694 RepID=A0A7Y6NH09_9GAMM|nr:MULTISPECIES: hypothetical protein [Pantoea]MBZ6396988.1 hypothetical protein [Pantoea sp.]MBZ6440261.1 hypothetical protein [Pantoea sp.]NUY43475.1 hypothetical protein [Pantoea brenneri]NUY50959.1 hypothetical protein [Pantoea brenneri]NUY61310.1 hypothetical protein [Pantoea brenneri]
MEPVEISIGRPGNSLDDHAVVRIVIRIDMGKTITVEMNAIEFALVLTGASDRPATMRTRNLELKKVTK